MGKSGRLTANLASRGDAEKCLTASLDACGHILSIDYQFAHLLGYGEDALIGRSIDICLAPEETQSIAARVGRSTVPFNMTCCLQAREASRIWLQLICVPNASADGCMIYAVDATRSQEEFRRLNEHMAVLDRSHVMLDLDLDGKILRVNQRFLDVFGCRRDAVVGQNALKFVGRGSTNPTVLDKFWSEMRAGRYLEREIRCADSFGGAVWLRILFLPVPQTASIPGRIVCCGSVVTADVVRRSGQEGQIKALDKTQCVAEFSLDGTILFANDRFCALLGYEPGELVGQAHGALRGNLDEGSASGVSHWETLRANAFQAGMIRCVGKEGRDIWLQATYCPIADANGEVTKIVKIATDVTRSVVLAAAFEDAQRRSQHDSDTGLPNRTKLIGFLDSLLVGGGEIAVLYLDLDRFKRVNDTLGHRAGDHVLAVVADRLRRRLSRDQLAARLGGDEFVIVAPALPSGSIAGFCRDLISAVGRVIHFEGDRIKVGVSIGVAVTPTGGTSPDDLLRCADIALHRAKQGGRDQFVFYSSALKDSLISYQAQIDEMRIALAANQFALEFQPRYNARTRAVTSVEALVRWHHPLRGRVPPAEFIPIAERSRLILPLGEWVLREACEHANNWPGIGVSVNISPVQIHEMDIAALVSDILRKTGLEPARLELEITEGTLFADPAHARDALIKLKTLGVRIAMDDFGVGYSSLGSLRSFPFDALKIDRQFIEAMDDNESGRQIVQAILTIGRALDLSVTAEGVETRSQLAVLADDGCPEVQGFLLSHPVSAARIDAILKVQKFSPDLPEDQGARVLSDLPEDCVVL